jgi:hypothetical protein
MIKEIQGSRNILIIVHWITASQENRKMCKFTISIITFSSYFVRSDFYRTVWSTITWTYRPLNYRNVGLKPHAAQQVIMYNVITISLCTFTHEISCYDLPIKIIIFLRLIRNNSSYVSIWLQKAHEGGHLDLDLWSYNIYRPLWFGW